MFPTVVLPWGQPWCIVRCGFTKFREVVSRLMGPAPCERVGSKPVAGGRMVGRPMAVRVRGAAQTKR